MHLLRRIERFLRATDFTATRLGREAVSDPRFVFDLRSGREPRRNRVPRPRLARRPRRPGFAAMGRSCGRALAALIRGSFADFDGKAIVEVLAERDWASVTFCGARHRLQAILVGAGAVGAAADFLKCMGEMELTLPGHIVADIALIAEARRDGGGYAWLELEALTIEDR